MTTALAFAETKSTLSQLQTELTQFIHDRIRPANRPFIRKDFSDFASIVHRAHVALYPIVCQLAFREQGDSSVKKGEVRQLDELAWKALSVCERIKFVCRAAILKTSI